MITASGNIPRFLADTLPDAYAEVLERRARLAADRTPAASPRLVSEILA